VTQPLAVLRSTLGKCVLGACCDIQASLEVRIWTATSGPASGLVVSEPTRRGAPAAECWSGLAAPAGAASLGCPVGDVWPRQASHLGAMRVLDGGPFAW
jgi:hypothetical protein